MADGIAEFRKVVREVLTEELADRPSLARSATSTLRAEELVYQVADELGLTEAERQRIDASAVAEAIAQSLRIEIKRSAGRQMEIEDYLLS